MTDQKDKARDELDSILDRVLDSYTPVAPRIGLEKRLQTKLAAEGQGPEPRLRLPLRWAWGFSAVLAAFAIVAVLHYRQSPTESKQQANPANSPLIANAQDGTPKTAAVARSSVSSRKEKRSARRAKPISAIDLASLREMRAPSHPAPEEPLTHQERLLLRIVHQGDPQLMAMLNPEVRAKEDEESEAEFHQWVEQSMKGEGE